MQQEEWDSKQNGQHPLECGARMQAMRLPAGCGHASLPIATVYVTSIDTEDQRGRCHLAYRESAKRKDLHLILDPNLITSDFLDAGVFFRSLDAIDLTARAQYYIQFFASVLGCPVDHFG